jgi:hypothetical protein
MSDLQERAREIAIGDQVVRVNDVGNDYGEIGTVVELEEKPGRATARQARVTELRIRVQWSERRTWMAVSGEGKRWRRVAAVLAEGGGK